MNPLNLKEKKLTVVVPAKNEEENILGALAKAKSTEVFWKEIEVLFFDDGSEDRTRELAQKFLQENFKDYRVFRNEISKNLGGVFKQALALAKGDYILVIQGQNVTTEENLRKQFQAAQSGADLIVPFQENAKERGFVRYAISETFSFLVRIFSGVGLRYFNHSVLMKTKQAQRLKIRTNSYAFQAEILIKLIRRGASYVEVPARDVFKHKKKTSAFKPKNLAGVAFFFFLLLGWRLLPGHVHEKMGKQ